MLEWTERNTSERGLAHLVAIIPVDLPHLQCHPVDLLWMIILLVEIDHLDLLLLLVKRIPNIVELINNK